MTIRDVLNWILDIKVAHIVGLFAVAFVYRIYRSVTHD